MDGAVPAIEALVGIIECLRKWNLLEEGGQSKSPSTHEKAAQSGKMIVLVDTVCLCGCFAYSGTFR